MKTLEGHSNNVMAVAWSIHGLLAIGSYDNTVKIWNPSAGECLKTLKGHNGAVLCVEWAQDGSQLVIGGGDYKDKLWSSDRRMPQHPERPQCPDQWRALLSRRHQNRFMKRGTF